MIFSKYDSLLLFHLIRVIICMWIDAPYGHSLQKHVGVDPVDPVDPVDTHGVPRSSAPAGRCPLAEEDWGHLYCRFRVLGGAAP